MTVNLPPAHLPGAQLSYPTTKRFVQRRLHNRRITMTVTPEGNYYAHFAAVLQRGEAAEMRQAGHVDKVTDYIVRDRVRYWTLVLTPEAFGAMADCWRELLGMQQRKRG